MAQKIVTPFHGTNSGAAFCAFSLLENPFIYHHLSQRFAVYPANFPSRVLDKTLQMSSQLSSYSRQTLIFEYRLVGYYFFRLLYYILCEI